jgi:iduronate 2-sulfatase
MTRPNVVLPLVFALLPAGASAQAATASSHPNVLFVVVDDMNTDLGCYGNRVVKSPNIDRLAARGVRFDRAYCQCSLCNPSRTSFLSGRRPETSGVYVLSTKACAAMPDAVMLPQLFRQNGYFCAGAGKVHHNASHHEPESWEFYEDGKGEDAGEKAAIEARYGGGDGTPRAYVLDSDGSKTRDGLNARTINAYLEEHARTGKPFFLAAGFHKPHLPWTAPRRCFDLYPAGSIPECPSPTMRNVPEVALQTELSGFAPPASRVAAIGGYYACISFTDENLGMLLDTLDRTKLWETTVVVFLSDNGWHLGDHDGLWSKLTIFENGTRVPLIFAGAGVPRGKVVTHPVELLDIYPTLVELAGLEAPPGLEGTSLVPAMKSDKPAPGAHAFSMIYHYDTATGSDILGRSVKTSAYRYNEWSNNRRDSELYLAGQPLEDYDNLVDQTGAAAQQREGEQLLRDLKPPKPGPAERPRALSKDGKAENKKKGRK